MTAQQKAEIVKILEASKGDDLFRAERAFRGHDLSVKYGESGKTKQEILDEYRQHSSNIDVLIAHVNGLKASAQ